VGYSQLLRSLKRAEITVKQAIFI
jgi:CheY-like chemotaxis protein